MGIGITSNKKYTPRTPFLKVSIPNGDRHYLEQNAVKHGSVKVEVSIPNGDRHYLELERNEFGQIVKIGFNPQWG